MQTELVEKKKWISQSRFLHALNFCMLLPGPEAQQLAIYVGWLLHKTWGGIVAGALFVIPSMFVLWGLSYVYVAYGSIPWLAADLLRPQAGRHGNRRLRRDSHRIESTKELNDVEHRRTRIRRQSFSSRCRFRRS